METKTIYIIANDGVTKTESGSSDNARVGLVVLGLATVGAYVVGKKVYKVVEHIKFRKFYK